MQDDDKSERPGACGARALARKSKLPAVERQTATIIIWKTQFETQGPQSRRHRMRNRPGAHLRGDFPISSFFGFSLFSSGRVPHNMRAVPPEEGRKGKNQGNWGDIPKGNKQPQSPQCRERNMQEDDKSEPKSQKQKKAPVRSLSVALTCS